MKAFARRVLGNLKLLPAARQSIGHLRQMPRRVLGLNRRLYRHYWDEQPVRKLHIGCGENILSGWLNSDFLPKSPEVLHLDATQPFFFQDDSFDYVFSEHMIEHISYRDGLTMLNECRRVLKPGGKIRISTPDLEFAFDLYKKPAQSPLQLEYIDRICQLFDFPGKEIHDRVAFAINDILSNYGHVFIYDETTLANAMKVAGFADTRRCELQESEDPALRGLEHEARFPPGHLRLETFTLEATKPRPRL